MQLTHSLFVISHVVCNLVVVLSGKNTNSILCTNGSISINPQYELKTEIAYLCISTYRQPLINKVLFGVWPLQVFQKVFPHVIKVSDDLLSLTSDIMEGVFRQVYVRVLYSLPMWSQALG